jgi:hypothetical protein
MVVVGCGDNGGHAASPDGSTADGTTPAGFPAKLAVSATNQTIALPFDLMSTGTANAPLGSVAMTHDVGTVTELAGAAPAFVYMTQQFGMYTLYQGLGVTASSWDVFWLYCIPTNLTFVYDEGVGGAPLFGVPATGSCQSQAAPHDAMVSLPAFSITTPTPIAGYTVDGPDISIATTGVGTLTLAGRTLPLLVFQDVDCTTTCGSPGWYELHSIIWDEAAQTLLFTIIYLSTDQHAQVELTYARSLPDLGDPIGDLRVPATWTAHPAAQRPHHMTMPPPLARAL